MVYRAEICTLIAGEIYVGSIPETCYGLFLRGVNVGPFVSRLDLCHGILKLVMNSTQGVFKFLAGIRLFKRCIWTWGRR